MNNCSDCDCTHECPECISSEAIRTSHFSDETLNMLVCPTTCVSFPNASASFLQIANSFFYLDHIPQSSYSPSSLGTIGTIVHPAEALTTAPTLPLTNPLLPPLLRLEHVEPTVHTTHSYLSTNRSNPILVAHSHRRVVSAISREPMFEREGLAECHAFEG